MPGERERGEMRNEERGEEEEACGWSHQPNLTLTGRSEGKAGAHRERTRHPRASEFELLHLGRELELCHIAWERGKGAKRNE